MSVVQAYRFALDPTPAQQQGLASHCGAQRFAYNRALDLVRANLSQRQAERSYDVPEEQLIPAVPWSAYGLRKLWNRGKGEIAPWWAENSKEAYSSGLANLAAALGAWKTSRGGARRGKPVGFPRFRSKRGRASCRFTTGTFGLANTERRHITLPRIGMIRTQESTRKVARHVERGTARIRSATVSFQQGRWFVSFSVEITRADPPPSRPEAAVGVDLGVRNLAVLSTGEVVTNPKHLAVALRELRRLQRRAARQHGPDRRTGQTPSARWRATQARIARVHARVANLRRDELHQLTTRLVRTFGTIVLEDLHITGMLANHHLAPAVADAGLAELRRQVAYKTTWRGGHLLIADRWYPSSKTCSDCGAVKTRLRLSERLFTCEHCGLSIDRDLNATHDLAALANRAAPSTASCAGTQNTPAGNPRKTTTLSGVPGTGYRHGKTPATAGANVAPQGDSSGTF